MNHFIELKKLVIDMCRDPMWLNKHPFGFSTYWEWDQFNIDDCENGSFIFRCPIQKLSDDGLVNKVLEFLNKPLIEDHQTLYIRDLLSLAHEIGDGDHCIAVTRDSRSRPRVWGDYRLFIQDMHSFNMLLDIDIENLTTLQIYEKGMPILEEYKVTQQLNDEIYDLAHKMNRDWDDCIELQPKMYELLKRKFEE